MRAALRNFRRGILRGAGWSRVAAAVFSLACFVVPCGCGRREPASAQFPRISPPAHPAMREGLSERSSGESWGLRNSGRAQASRAEAERGSFLERLADFGLTAEVPSGWKEISSASSMRLATFSLERAEGDPGDAELSVVAAMGSEEANIERWRSQFEGAPEPLVASREVGALRIVVVELAGTFIADGNRRPGFKLWGAIVGVPGRKELVFFKCWGPAGTVEKWRGSLEQFLSSLSAKR